MWIMGIVGIDIRKGGQAVSLRNRHATSDGCAYKILHRLIAISAMASTSDNFNEEIARRPPKKGSPIKFLIPLIYAPVLPLIRIAFRRDPVLRGRLFAGVLAGAFVHGMYLVTDLYDAESKS